MSANPLMLLTAIELLDGYATGDIDPVDALDQCIDGLSTVGRDNGVTLAIADGVAVREAALVARMRWRTGTARPLEGVPFGVKDIIATSDMRTTGGASVMGDLVPRSDAPCVARLRADGAIPKQFAGIRNRSGRSSKRRGGGTYGGFCLSVPPGFTARQARS